MENADKEIPILIISDSLAMPRLEPLTEISITYPYLLQARYKHIFASSYGGSTSRNILHQAVYFDGTLSEGLCILHFGVVDCYPRIFSKYEARVLRILGCTVSKKITDFLLKIRLVRDVSPQDFRSNCIEIRKKNLGKLIVLAISKSPSNNENKSPHINNSIYKYNEILKDVFGDSFFDCQIDPESEISSDSVHLNEIGHLKVYLKLVDRIEKILRE
jgi:hypothetical protein